VGLSAEKRVAGRPQIKPSTRVVLGCSLGRHVRHSHGRIVTPYTRAPQCFAQRGAEFSSRYAHFRIGRGIIQPTLWRAKLSIGSFQRGAIVTTTPKATAANTNPTITARISGFMAEPVALRKLYLKSSIYRCSRFRSFDFDPRLISRDDSDMSTMFSSTACAVDGYPD
jgi:hypothetical protein